MPPVPLGDPQLAPPAAAQVQLAPVRPPGTVSDTAAPWTSLLPALPTLIVKVSTWPGTAVATPSDFVTKRSAAGRGGTNSKLPRSGAPTRATPRASVGGTSPPVTPVSRAGLDE